MSTHDPEHSRYEVKYLIFLDVLGWSRLVASASHDTLAFSLASDVATALSGVYQKAAAHVAKSECHPAAPRFEFFSDTIVASVIFDKNLYWPEKVVLEICKESARATLRHGMLVRGGVCRGSIRHLPEQRICFGPALLRAYELESKIAKVPRIVLDEEISDWFVINERLINDEPDALDYKQRSPLHRDKDGLFHVDYLGPDFVNKRTGHPTVDERDAVAERLLQAKMVTSHYLTQDDLDPSLRVKYEWFESYRMKIERETEIVV